MCYESWEYARVWHSVVPLLRKRDLAEYHVTDLTSYQLRGDMTAVEATSRCAGGALSKARVGVSGN
jgi:hypothetical protein